MFTVVLVSFLVGIASFGAINVIKMKKLSHKLISNLCLVVFAVFTTVTVLH